MSAWVYVWLSAMIAIVFAIVIIWYISKILYGIWYQRRDKGDELDSEQIWIVRKASKTKTLPPRVWTHDSLFAHFCANTMPPQDKRVFNTTAHQQMVSRLFSLCQGLSQGDFVGHNGTATCLLVGAKGIGKTTTARTFIHCVPELFPRIIGVYANYLGLCPDHALRQNSLVRVINCQLMGKAMSAKGMLSATSVLETWLENKQRKLFLIVDELDELYRRPSEKHLEDTLNELQLLGNSTKGRIAVLLCGSSAMLPALISRKIKDLVSFPMLQNAPNLNGHKYQTNRVFTPLPVSLNVVQGLYPSATETQCRSLLFYAGGNVREIEKVLKRDINVEYSSVLFSDSNSNSTAALQPFLYCLLQALVKKNKALLKQLEKDFSTTMTTAWETQFNYLTDEETSACWKEFSGETKVDRSKMDALYHLSDRGFLVVTSTADVYPASVSLLLESLDFQKKISTYRKLLRDYLPTAKGAVTGAVTGAVSGGVSVGMKAGLGAAMGGCLLQ